MPGNCGPGGEPAIHNLQGLAYQLKSRNLPVHLETCGAYHVNGEIDWITVSPKWTKPPIEETLERVDEYKIIIEDETSIEKWSEAHSLKNEDIPSGCTPSGQESGSVYS